MIYDLLRLVEMSNKTMVFINTRLQPGGGGVFRRGSRFNGLPARDKPLKRF
jgi:hypothetical protein